MSRSGRSGRVGRDNDAGKKQTQRSTKGLTSLNHIGAFRFGDGDDSGCISWDGRRMTGCEVTDKRGHDIGVMSLMSFYVDGHISSQALTNAACHVLCPTEGQKTSDWLPRSPDSRQCLRADDVAAGR